VLLNLLFDTFTRAFPALFMVLICGWTSGLRPDRIRKINVILPAWNDMPMQMRHYITEAGEVDLVRLNRFAHGGFNRKDHVEQPGAVRG